MTRDVKQLHDLNGRTALVTGGSRGLGLQMAKALGEAGARVIITSRKVLDLEQAAADLQSTDFDVSWIAADCARVEELGALVELAVERLGHIDILVNNAGASWGEPAEDCPVEAWDKVMNLNVRGYFLLSQLVAKASMIERRSGSIINVASIGGLGGNRPELKTIAYNTSKGAVLNFTRALAAEWGVYNIRVNAVCPGWFRTKMASGVIDSIGEQEMISGVPLGRFGDDEDLKGICLLFASDAGKHVTGQHVAIDGGASIVTVR